MTDKRVVAPRANEATHQERVQQVLELLMTGRPRSFIVQYVANNWGLALRTADKLIADARKVLREINSATREESIEQITANFWLIYRNALANKDLHLALNTLREIAKLKGLNETLVTHTIKDTRTLLEFNDAELERELENQVHLNDSH